MIGYPGSGKTTIAKYIHELTGAVHIWADYERQRMFGHQTQASQDSKQLYRALNKKADELLREGRSVVFDTNFRFRKDRDALREIATKAGAYTVIIWVTTDRTTAKERATHLAEHAPNRFFGNISEDDFNRVTSHIQEPTPEEQVLAIRGVDVTKSSIAALLGISGT